MLHAVEERLAEAGEPVALLGQKKDSEGERFAGQGFIESVTDNGEIDPTHSDHRRDGLALRPSRASA